MAGQPEERIRDAAIKAIEHAFETMDAETGRKLTAALDDPEQTFSLVVWLPGSRIDICAIPAEPGTPPQVLFSAHCGH